MNILWFAMSTFSLLVIAITMLCRANDLRWRRGLKWHVRLIGFVIVGTMPIGIVGSEWVYQSLPSPYEAFFRFGLMCVFVTTPYLPPWWKWISGKGDAHDTN